MAAGSDAPDEPGRHAGSVDAPQEPWVALARSGEPLAGTAFAAPCYRIPALTVTASGRVLAAWDVRADWRDLPGPFDLVIRHSDDHGRTWSPPRFLRRHEGNHGFGDASLIATASGRVLAWYAGSTGESFFSATADGPGLEVWLAASDDDGATWTHRLMPDLRPAGVGGMFASSGNGTHLASGRLLQPFVLRRPGPDAAGLTHAVDRAEHGAAVAASDDDGATWTLGPWLGPDCDENKVVEGPSGVVLHGRARPRRRWAVSTDEARTFTRPEAHPDLVDPACNGGLARWGDALVCSLPDDPALRRRLAVRTSGDGGRTWGPAVVVDAGAAAYSVLAPLADGALGLLYEAGDYEALIFRRLAWADVAAGVVRVRPGSGSARPPEVAPS